MDQTQLKSTNKTQGIPTAVIIRTTLSFTSDGLAVRLELTIFQHTGETGGSAIAALWMNERFRIVLKETSLAAAEVDFLRVSAP